MKAFSKIFIVLALLAGFQTVNAEWVKRNTNTFAWFKDIYFQNQSKGWMLGTDGVLLSTEDGGTTWVQAKKFTADNLIQIHFTTDSIGWMLCERSVLGRNDQAMSYLRRTTNGGKTWDRVDFQDIGRQRVTHLLFNEDGVGMAFGEGGAFYKLQEDGLSWVKTQTPMHYLLLDGAYGSDKVGAIVGAGGSILFTEDSGFTWEKASLIGDTETRFNSVYFAGSKGAWAVGTKGRIFHSNGGGRLWRQQESGTTANLTDVYFSSATSGWAVGENGVIVRTRDGGNTWSEVGSKTTHRLEKVVFNGSRGWVVGFGGTVMTYDDGVGTPDPGTKPVLMKRS